MKAEGKYLNEKMAKVRRSRFAFVLVLAQCLVVGRCAAAGPSQAIELRGTYDCTVYQREQVVSTGQYLFTAWVKECAWFIDYSNANPNVLTDRVVAACDGTNIYTILYQNEAVVKRVWKERYDSVKSNLPTARVFLYPGTIPPPQESVLYHLWLALGSQCVLSSPQGKTKPPFAVDSALFANREYACEYVWTTNTATGVRSLILNSDGRIMARNGQGDIVSGSIAPPLDKGFQIAVGKWHQQTNLLGISLPLEYEFNAFAPAMLASKEPTSQLVKAYDYRCVATNAFVSDFPPIPPLLPASRVMVDDERFADRGYASIRYLATNQWYQADDPYVLALLAVSPKISQEMVAKRLYSTGVAGKTNARVVIWLLLALPLIVLLVFAVINKRRSPSRKEACGQSI